MLNILSLLIGIVGLLLAIPAFLPFFGLLNWFILPVPLIGLAFGMVSSRNSGRNLNLLVLIVIVVRLILGGGIL